MVDRYTMDILPEFEQLKYFIIGYELYSLMHQNTFRNFTISTFAYFYECFEDKLPETRSRYWFVQDGRYVFKDDCEVVPIKRWIKLDKTEIEPVVAEFMREKGITINQLQSLGNDYFRLPLGADGYEYTDLSEDIPNIQAVE